MIRRPFIVLAALAAVACGKSEQPVTLCEPPGACESFQEDKGPSELPKGDPAKGATLYASSCASCHGKDGKGTPTVRAGLDFTQVAWQKGLTDLQMARVIQRGRGTMPRFEWPLDDIAAVIAHVRALQAAPAAPAKGY